MPVQGSIDTFPVRGLLEFLARTERTGRLVVHAEPCLGLVALREGRLVGAGVGADASMPTLAASPSVTSLGDVLADVVTWPSGRFAFHPDGVGGNARGFEVGETLAAVDELLSRHGDDSDLTIEHVVQLNEEPGFRRVHLDHEHWQIVSAVGDGATVAALAHAVGLGLPAVRRRVAELVGLGLATVRPSLASAA